MNAANIKNDDYNFKHSNHWTINDRNINHWQRKATCWPSQQSSSQSMLIVIFTSVYVLYVRPHSFASLPPSGA